MKVKELIKIGEKIMKLLHERGITMDYYQYLPLIQEFDIMKDMGHKTTYIIAHLSEKYGICERKVYKIIGKMSLVFVGKATSEEQKWDTIAHEVLDHAKVAICDYYDVSFHGEDVAWLTGFLMRKIVQQIAPPCSEKQ